MKTLFLTTQTTHHAYFVQEVIKRFPLCRAITETTGVQAPFDAGHESDAARDRYEIETCLGGQNTQIADLIETTEVNNINDSTAIALIQDWKPDIIVDFGTRKVKEDIINCRPERIVNLHGGDPQHYRGLDTHMWAMYHRDFEGLVTTLHTLNPELDDGEIIEIKAVPLFKDMKIHQFHRYNTEVCIEMVCNLLHKLDNGEDIISTPQQQKGRYYSFMPRVLKDIAAKNFEKYTAQIDG